MTRSTAPAVVLALALSVSLGGCVPHVRFRAEVAPTSLVAVSSGVWAVYDYPEAVFYADGAYWWWNDGSWYRSAYADSGWVYVQIRVVPAGVRGIERPHGYVRYRAAGARRPVPAEHVTGRYDSPARGRGPADEPGERGRGHGGDDRGGDDRGPDDRARDDDRGARGREHGEAGDDGRPHDDERHDAVTPTVRVPDPADDRAGRGREDEHGRSGDAADGRGGDDDRAPGPDRDRRGDDEHERRGDPGRATPTPAPPPPAAPAPATPRRGRRADPPRSGDDDGAGSPSGTPGGGRGRGRGRGSDADRDGDGPH